VPAGLFPVDLIQPGYVAVGLLVFSCTDVESAGPGFVPSKMVSTQLVFFSKRKSANLSTAELLSLQLIL
jgi:hypothetical protein